MIRWLGRLLKPLLLAVLILALLPCVAEVWLRWQEFRAGRPLLAVDLRDELIAPSWQTHHQLKPLRTITARSPDSGESDTQTNSFGLRGPEPSQPKVAGTLRVIVLGDETVLGLEVADDETFAVRLQEQLKSALRQPVEVLNAAAPDDCPLLAALRLKHELLGLRPDLVICHFDMTDVADDYSYRRLVILGRGDEPLACPHPLLDKPIAGVGQQFGDHFLLAKYAQRQLARFWRNQRPDEPTDDIAHPLSRYAWIADDPPDWSLHIQQAFAALSDVGKVAATGSCRLLVTTCPAPWQVSSTASSGDGVREAAGVPDRVVYQSQLPFRLLRDFCKQRGLAFCDASDEFRAEPLPDKLYLQNAPRLTPAGHDLYASSVAKFLSSQSVATPPPTANGTSRTKELR